MVQPLKFGNGLVISYTLYWVYDDLSVLGLKLIHFSKSGPRSIDNLITKGISVFPGDYE